jgi:hypothetical protein
VEGQLFAYRVSSYGHFFKKNQLVCGGSSFIGFFTGYVYLPLSQQAFNEFEEMEVICHAAMIIAQAGNKN